MDFFNDEYFMRLALRQAEAAADEGEVPVGAVAVKDGTVIAKARNQVETLKDATAHAEVILLTRAAAAMADWRMDGVTIYVTKEPCAMCAGAMVNARVEKLVFGLADPRMGAAGSAIDVTGFKGMLHQVKVVSGILEPECRRLFQEFFRQLRENGKPKPMRGGTEVQSP